MSADQHDAPLFRLEFNIELADYEEATAVHNRAWGRAMSWQTIAIWLLGFALVIIPRLWLQPDNTVRAAGVGRLPQSLFNLLVASLPLLVWLMLFVFIWLNVFLGMRPRRPDHVPTFQYITPEKLRHCRAYASVWMVSLVLALTGAVDVIAESRNARAAGTEMSVIELGVAAFFRLLPAIAGVVIAILLMVFNAFSRTRSTFDRQPHLQLRHTYEFFDSHVVSSNSQSTSDSSWTSYLKAIESPNLFVLCKTDVAIEMIPKRAFARDAEWQGFRTYVKERLPSGVSAFPVVTTDIR